MLKDKTLTYISLFSSAGVGCYGFKQEGYKCIATNEFIERRLDVQKFNNKCDLESGYILGDITLQSTKNKIFQEIEKYKKLGNDRVDVLIATPPCQGMSVANHKKRDDEIIRNSLVVESILLTKQIQPKVFLFENVSAFLKTGCTSPSGEIKAIKDVIFEELSDKYVIKSQILNFKNYGSNSSRTRTLVIGIDKTYEEDISPIDLFPRYRPEKKLKEVVKNLPALTWGEINKEDILHAFRTYPENMREWITDLNQGESAFDNSDIKKRPHKIVDGQIVENKNKNGDKYTRQKYDCVAPCIHTRNDQLASQNTIHPIEDRVFSIRELMLMMTIPESFKWDSLDYKDLNNLSEEEKRAFYKKNEIKIRQSIGEAVPTEIFRQIAYNIKREFSNNNIKLDIKKTIDKFNLEDKNTLIKFIKDNPEKYSFTVLSKLAELANAQRLETDAYYTNKSLLNYIYDILPNTSAKEVRILEPSVGVGNFIPYIIKKYETVEKVYLDVVDIDNNSLDILKVLLEKTYLPKNIEINYINSDYLLYEEPHKYFLVCGNPPFTKINKSANKNYYNNVFNQDTNNLAGLFIEKAINNSSNTVMIMPKNIINTKEFEKTREFIANKQIQHVLDFGEKGFKGVLIETVCLATFNEKVKNKNTTTVLHIPTNTTNTTLQVSMTSNEYPYWLLYRNNFFDEIASKMDFDKFTVFRDRQITNSNTTTEKKDNYIRVLKSRNIDSSGNINSIENYDAYISEDELKTKAVYKYYNDIHVFLAPNMTYYPRMIRNIKGVTVNGSVAILIPKDEEPTDEQIKYFASEEFREFYKIARNLQTRSLNIDKTSVFFFGYVKE